jgi:hypothetical protein
MSYPLRVRHMQNRSKTTGELVAEYFQEYLEAVTRAQQFQVSNVRHWTLIQCYAELQFRLNGGSKCAICRASVRHVIPVTAERADGRLDEYACLCARCYEGERASSSRIVMHLGEAHVEETPREYGKQASDYTHPGHSKAAS